MVSECYGEGYFFFILFLKIVWDYDGWMFGKVGDYEIVVIYVKIDVLDGCFYFEY